jgi:membrane associated rhomboid family serine protease
MEISIFILLITCAVSIFCFRDESLFSKLQFNAYDIRHSNQWFRFFTYGFVHANWLHLFINMFVLLSFGKFVETRFRILFHEEYLLYYILLYLGGMLFSIIPAYVKHKNDVFYNSVGASGAVSAVVFSSILLFPVGKIGLIFLPIGLPSPIFGILYIAYEVYMKKRVKDNIGHDAHIWGAIFGVIFTIAIRPAVFTEFLSAIGLTF